MFKDKKDFIKQYRKHIAEEKGKEFEVCSTNERYMMLAHLIAQRARDIKALNTEQVKTNGDKTIYYFSIEFLLGKLLENYLQNFNVLDIVRSGLADLGEDIDILFAQERDAGLGNGGLGRLAACFIDSLATLNIEGHGNGIRYRYGLFHQKIENASQIEYPDNWLKGGYPWEVRDPEHAVIINFNGKTVCHQDNDKAIYRWENTDKILAVPYYVPIVGHNGTTVNNLCLWSAEPYEEDFDMDAFNRGDYSTAVKFRSDVEAITSILYPNENADPGKVLRLKQEYMFVAAGLKNIIIDFKNRYQSKWHLFDKKIAIHTNDTHPSLCAPELMRLLIDEEGLAWDTAWHITINTLSYTNHTILPEASEKWPIDMFRKLLPRIYDMIEEIDRRYREAFDKSIDNWQELLRNTTILWDNQVRMANLSIIAGHAVNGVSALHTKILMSDTLKDFYQLMPEKFVNVTNGVSHRRFLVQANPSLAKAINKQIGDDWINNIDHLNILLPYQKNRKFLKQLAIIKHDNKERLASYILKTSGLVVDPNSIFDVQVKRFHAYKRQLLNIFKVMTLYNQLIDDPSFDITPTTFIFAGKAAQGYEFAKETIRLINTVGNRINNDHRVNHKIKIAFIEDFAVSNAQLIYPAADISEQISTAGLEASGTGNMKFMMNGALTLGTLDGATVEIYEAVGEDNIFIFGLSTEMIDDYKKNASYLAWEEYSNDHRLKKVIDQLTDGTYSGNGKNFAVIADGLLKGNDQYFTLKDFDDYMIMWTKMNHLYRDSDTWQKLALNNIARSGYFASDRSISDYYSKIWNKK